jgi:dihydroorotate dehydrogenase (NAD+) catalytic subunit
MNKNPLQTKFLNLTLKNPVVTAAGTFGYGEEFKDFFDISQLGAIIVKGTSFDPWPGNPAPRICETPSGMLNCIGLQNYGLKYFVAKIMPKLHSIGNWKISKASDTVKYGRDDIKTKLIVSVFDKTVDNYIKIVNALDKVRGIDALEINLSCPNIEAGGKTLCAEPNLIREVLTKVKKATTRPIIAKLSPNVTDIVEIAKAAVDVEADALSLINTVLGMSINIKTRRPNLSRNVGGLSGPAIHPIAVANVWKVHRAIPSIPIIGIGGIYDTNSAIEMILAGATLVGIGTANFYNPRVCLEIIEGMRKYCEENKIKEIGELRGTVKDY